MDVRTSELLAWEVETGRQLPLPADVILAVEDAGGCVDLDTGAVLDVAGDVFDVTVVCEAWHVVTQHEAAP
jgi:hypothetical protein